MKPITFLALIVLSVQALAQNVPEPLPVYSSRARAIISAPLASGVELPSSEIAPVAGISAETASVPQRSAKVETRLHSIVSKGPRGTRPLVISFENTNAAVLRALEEDLVIMNRILSSGIPFPSKTREKAMGIAITGHFFSSAGTPRMMYLEDHGAVFIYDVPFPLVPPPQAAEQQRPPESTSSEWERARSEVFGPAPGSEEAKLLNPSEEPKYQPEWVDELKKSIVMGFKNASHIRHLKPEEWITVVLLGAGGSFSHPIVDTTIPGSAYGRGGGGSVRFETPGPAVDVFMKLAKMTGEPPGGTESKLILRVRKSDADAFAKGELDFDQFRQKVSEVVDSGIASSHRHSGDAHQN